MTNIYFKVECISVKAFYFLEILNQPLFSQTSCGIFKEVLKTPAFPNKRLIDNVDDVVHGK